MALLSRKIGLVVSFVLMLSGLAHAGLEARTWVDRDEIAIGDTFNLYVEITYDKDVEMKPLALGEALGEFTIRDIGETEEEIAAGRLKRTFNLVLTIFDTGEHEIPSLPIIYVDSDGKTNTVETDPIEIKVESVLPDDASEIRDIKGPLTVAKRWKDLLLSYALLLSLVVGSALSVLFSLRHRAKIEALINALLRPIRYLLYYVLRFLKFRKYAAALDSRFDVSIDEPDIAPEEAAIRELERIEALGLLDKGMVKEHYSLVSETVRRYIERRYDILAMEQPTGDTLRDLEEKAIPGEGYRLIEDLLRESDLVKFAKFVPPREVAMSAIERARQIIEKTACGEQLAAGVASQNEA